ncbi:MAG: enoyl-CoA hydratase-related protein [Chloroflexota bacterium]|nr:enoyl-CoA hydratase-related protein [Chloroflexota bacterium]
MSKIDFSVQGHIAGIQLNRPEKLNAIDRDMLDRLAEIVEQVDQSVEARVLVLRASGERAFCVGADIHAWTSLAPLDMWRRWIRDGHRLFDRIAALRQPVIAVLNGFTLGGGLELALAADIRLAADAIELGFPEASIATVPGWGGTDRLPALIGAGRAKQMIFSAQRISATTAEHWGLVNEVLPPDQLDSRADELARQIAANAPLAVQFAKQAINGALQGAAGSTLEALAGALAAHSQDAQEGLASFSERRPPDYSGN